MEPAALNNEKDQWTTGTGVEACDGTVEGRTAVNAIYQAFNPPVTGLGWVIYWISFFVFYFSSNALFFKAAFYGAK